jgi:hypothetical protein
MCYYVLLHCDAQHNISYQILVIIDLYLLHLLSNSVK